MDDAASVALGGKWRMPTEEECMELSNPDNCYWTWTTIDGVKGRKVQSKKSGYTDNWIFLPAAGYREQYGFNNVGSQGAYWSSCISAEITTNACYMRFELNDRHSGFRSRFFGLSVRPVLE